MKFTPARRLRRRDAAAPSRRAPGSRCATPASGSTPAEIPHIFERFYRGSRANEARGIGSGLGLAIVKSIVDMHGGRISVESRLGTGTTFVVILPRDPKQVEIGPAAGHDVAAAARTTAPPDGRCDDFFTVAACVATPIATWRHDPPVTRPPDRRSPSSRTS